VKKTKNIRQASQRGFSLLEVLVASVILGIAVTGSSALQSALMQRTRATNDKAFATEKALQMFDELRAHTEGSQENFDESLANFSDGASYNQILTTDLFAATPADPLSLNPRFGNRWKYTRQVQIEPIENDEYARRVSVSVWQANEDGEPVDVSKPMAAISGILKTNIPKTPPTQSYDFYVISIANSPSWWSNLYDFRPAYEAVFGDLEFRNPGLNLRKRFITNMGFGRDPFYLPHTNTEATTAVATLPWAYFYPGKVTVTNNPGGGNPVKEDYSFDQITARIRGDLPSKQFRISEKSDVNKYRPYALSDEFNHVLRWPEQAAMERRLANYAENGISNSDILLNPSLRRLKDALKQPTLTSFLQGMNEGKFRNSMLSNMHAELTPVPPVRNYSDAAKIPLDERVVTDTSTVAINSDDTAPGKALINKRVVTHPERLFYSNTESTLGTAEEGPINWRVHAYETPNYGRALNQKPNGDNYSDDELIVRTIPHITLFMPTEGGGEYMTYPNLNANDLALQEDNIFRLRKVIGNPRLEYKYRGMVGDPSVTSPNANDYTLLTSADILFNSGAPAGHNPRVQQIGEIQYISNPADEKTSLVLNNRNPELTLAQAQNLIGDAIIINGSQASPALADVPGNREVAIVVNAEAITGTNTQRRTRSMALGFPNSGNHITLPNGGFPNGLNANTIVLTLDRVILKAAASSSTQHGVGELVTRHKDYEIQYQAPGFNSTQRSGVLFHLYNTPTRHPQHTPSNTGLHPDRRLYGLEYIPAPVNQGSSTTTGTTIDQIRDDFATDLRDNRANSLVFSGTPDATANPANRARNTARWLVSVAGSHAAFNNSLANRTLTMETRMIGGQGPTSLRGDINNYMLDGIGPSGDAYEPDDPNTPGNEGLTLRRNLYNVSRAYAYMGTSFEAAVPRIEQTQYIGDPRHMPYADVKARHGYNRAFFRTSNGQNINFANSGHATTPTGSNGTGGYAGYGEHTGRYVQSGYGDDGIIDVDVPRAFGLYTSGIMRSNSVYNTIAGYTNYIISLGGGIGRRGDHTYAYNVKQGPWTNNAGNANTNTDNGEGNGTVSERGSGGHRRFITSTNGGNNAWSGFNYLGEMFPDEFYPFWKENGNLPNLAYNSSDSLGGPNPNATINTVSGRFYRAPVTNTPYALHRRNVITMEGAISDFYNGSSNPTNTGHRIKHSTTGGNGCLQSNPGAAGRYLVDAFNMSLPESISATRSFCISSGSCTSPNGNNTAAYTTAEQSAQRNTIKYINLTGPNSGDAVNASSQFNTFYRFHTGGCGGGASLNVASGLIKLTREAIAGVAADPDLVGYAVINGLDQGSLFGAQSLSRLAQAATLQGFLEGGDKAIPGQFTGRIVPLPRLEVTGPDPNLIHSANSLNVEFKVEWSRWDQRKYTPSYPDDWYDTTPLNFNAVYSSDNGRTWFHANTGTPVAPENIGIYNPDEQVVTGGPFTMSGPSDTWNFPWNIAGFPDGSYILKVEAYRDGFDVGHSYHQIYITVKR